MLRHVGEGQDVMRVHDEVSREYASFVAHATKRLKCVQCGETFRPMENIIRRDCWLHTGELRPHPDLGYVWTCCKAQERYTGCVSCMHTNSEAVRDAMQDDPYNSVAEVPQRALDFALLRFNPDIIENYPEGGRSIEGRAGKFYHIRRVVV